jgi:hypothetical protein
MGLQWWGRRISRSGSQQRESPGVGSFGGGQWWCLRSSSDIENESITSNTEGWGSVLTGYYFRRGWIPWYWLPMPSLNSINIQTTEFVGSNSNFLIQKFNTDIQTEPNSILIWREYFFYDVLIYLYIFSILQRYQILISEGCEDINYESKLTLD